MNQRLFVILLILIMLPLVMLPLLDAPMDLLAYGRIRIPARGISAEMYLQPHENCGCCDPLFGGGEVYVAADFSAVAVGDMMDIVSPDGAHLVVECFEITGYIRIGRWLINRNGLIHADGDVLVLSDGLVYRFIIL